MPSRRAPLSSRLAIFPKWLPFSVCASLKSGLSARPHLFSWASFDARLKSLFARQQLKIRGRSAPLSPWAVSQIARVVPRPKRTPLANHSVLRPHPQRAHRHGSAGEDYLLPAPLHHIIRVQGEVPFDPRSAPRRRVQPLRVGEQPLRLLRPTQAISKLCE